MTRPDLQDKRGRAGDETSTSDEPADAPSRLPGFPPGHHLHDAWQEHVALITRETEDAADDPYHPRWEQDGLFHSAREKSATVFSMTYGRTSDRGSPAL